MIKYFFTMQFFGFLAVGGLAALLHWLSRLLLSFWLPFLWAVVTAYIVGMVIAYLLNRFFIFPNSKKPMHAQARDFFLVNLSFLPLVWLIAVLTDKWLKVLGMTSYTEELAHALAISIPMFATFLIYKFFTFKEKSYE